MSLVYQVRYQKHAGRRLHRMPRSVAQRIRTKLDEIAADPYGGHPNATRLRGADRDFRIRVGDWRVIYSLDDEQSVLLVARIDQRGQVYR